MLARLFLFSLSLIVLLSAAQDVGAQVAVNAGRKFAFGIPEGPDRQTDSTQGQSRIFLTIMGSAEGCASVRSPLGFSANVNFPANRQREIEIPLEYMQKWDQGFNQKGFIVETTQPAHVELHVVFPGASESTQIFPMDMLDGEYVLSGWSIWNDTFYNENNRAQFLITAAEDNTVVTITAPNGLLPNIAPGTTFNLTLNAGECYIGKMDTTLSIELSTSQVLVKASKPVNVIQANTCGYVPYGVQACNMLLDNILPRKYFDTKFVVQPISTHVGSDHILLTSDVMNFGAIVSDGTFYQTKTGRIDLIIDTPTIVEASVPVMCQILTPGSAQAEGLQNDPSWVTIPPQQLWDDTLMWYAQPAVGGIAQSFTHYASIIGPQSAFDEIMLDDVLLNSITAMEVIPGTPYFASHIQVQQGARRIKAPEPISVIVNGTAPNDVYSFVPGGSLPPRFHPVPQADINLTSTQAQFCAEMQATLANSLVLSALDQVTDLEAVITYDPAVLRVINARPGSFFTGISGVAVDLTISGEMRISYSSPTYLSGNGTLIDAAFAVDADVPATSFNGSLRLTTDEVCDNTRDFAIDLPVTITRVVESGSASISLTDLAARSGDIASADLEISDLPADALVREFDITLIWDHDFMEYESHDAAGMSADGWTVARIDESPTRMRLRFTAPSGVFLTNGKFARLNFTAFLSDALSTDVVVLASLPSSRTCPLELSVPQTTATFNSELLCGESFLVDLMAGRLNSAKISPNPASRSVELELASPMTGTAILLDAAGREITSWALTATNRLNLDLPSTIGSGSYIVSLRSEGITKNLPLIIQK